MSDAWQGPNGLLSGASNAHSAASLPPPWPWYRQSEGVADAVGLEVALLLAPRLRLALRVDAANLIGRPAVAATGPDADLSVLERVDLGLRAAAEEGQRYNDLHPCSIY